MNAKHIEGTLNYLCRFQGAGSRDSIPSTGYTQNLDPSVTSQNIPLADVWITWNSSVPVFLFQFLKLLALPCICLAFTCASNQRTDLQSTVIWPGLLIDIQHLSGCSKNLFQQKVSYKTAMRWMRGGHYASLRLTDSQNLCQTIIQDSHAQTMAINNY